MFFRVLCACSQGCKYELSIIKRTTCIKLHVVLINTSYFTESRNMSKRFACPSYSVCTLFALSGVSSRSMSSRDACFVEAENAVVVVMCRVPNCFHCAIASIFLGAFEYK